MISKKCRTCGKEKDISFFHAQRHGKHGVRAKCKACVRDWQVANEESIKSYRAAWQAKNRPRLLSENALYRAANKQSTASRMARYRALFPEKVRQISRNSYRKHAEERRASAMTYLSTPDNKAKARATSRDWGRSNPEKRRQISKRWRDRNPPRLIEARNRRRAAKLQATPAWADKSAMVAIYEECAKLTKQTGVAHHVDHSVPLRSNLVCGLHCEFNLQILTSVENHAKSNRYWPNMSISPEGT